MFCFNRSPLPWVQGVPPEMVPYDLATDALIARGVSRVCAGEVCSLLIPITVSPVLPSFGGSDARRCQYYVAAVRCNSKDVLLVQCRLDYTNRELKVLQRPVLAMEEFVCRFRLLKFSTAMLVPEQIDKLFWQAIRQEWSASVDSVVLSHPRHPVDDRLGAYYRRKSGGLGHFSRWDFSGTSFNPLPVARLSVVLSAAASTAVPGGFMSLIPLSRADGWKLFPAVVVMRAAGRSDVSVVFIDLGQSYTLSQHAVCFQRLSAGTVPPGVTVGSASLDKECVRMLFQEALYAHWSGRAAGERFPLVASPVACVAGGFQLSGLRLSAESERLLVAGIHQVCSVGGTNRVLVPVAGAGRADAALLVAVVRKIHSVSLSLVWLNEHGVVETAPLQGLPHDLAIASPFMDGIQFMGVRPTDREDIAAMFFDVVHNVWRQRFISLAFVQRANMVDGVRFYVKGFHLHVPVVAPADNALIQFSDDLGCWIELAIKILITDSNHTALLIPCVTNTKEMIAVVRRGGQGNDRKFLALHLTADGLLPIAVRAVDCSGFAKSQIDYMVHGVALEIADVRLLFDRVVYAHWKEISRVGPFNWPERRLAFALCTVPRLASASFLSRLTPSIVGVIGRLIV